MSLSIFRRKPERPLWMPAPPRYPCAVHDDPRFLLCNRAQDDPNFKQVLEDLDRGNELARREMLFLNADNASYFHDSKPTAFLTVDEAAVTGATTDKLIWAGGRTATPAGYFNIGKMVQIIAMFRMTTGATAGNMQQELYYGTTDAGGTLLASSGAIAAANAKTNISCCVTAHFQAWSAASPTARPMMAWAKFETDGVGVIITTASNLPIFTPATAPAVVNIDSTATQGVNVQYKNSGANASTYQTHMLQFNALN